MLIDNEDWATVDDSTLWHAAKGGAHGAAAELRRREMAHRTSPAQRAALVDKVKARK